MDVYAAYGLAVASEIPLPDLPAATSGRAPDATIRFGDVPTPGPTAVLSPNGLWVDGDLIGIDVPDVARYACVGGTTVTIALAAGAGHDDVRLFLLGSALGVLLTQRGLLVLHGNAFRVGDACAVVLGHSGAGKSTLAAEMARRGHDVLSDDVVPVDAEGRAVPGWARIKLWDDALERLGMPSDGLQRVRGRHEKFHVPLERGDLARLSVRWIYVLDRREGPLRLSPITGAGVFSFLHEHSYRGEILVGELRRTHLARSAVLAARARLARVDRPYDVDTVTASAELILAHITADITANITADITATTATDDSELEEAHVPG